VQYSNILAFLELMPYYCDHSTNNMKRAKLI